jgi:hypothetical protein
MKQRNQTMLKTLGVAMMLVGANAAMAQETVNVPASVTVDNAIDFQVTGTLNFGSVRAAAGAAAECAIIAMSSGASAPAITAVTGVGADDLAACTTAAATAALQSIGGTLERPSFELSGIAPFAALNLTLPTGPIYLSGAGLPPQSSRFVLGNFNAWQTAGGLTGDITTSLKVTVNGQGTAVFNVGAQLATDPVAIAGIGVAYQNDVVYSGTFPVTVAY